MKGIALLVLLISLLIVGYLTFKRSTTPVTLPASVELPEAHGKTLQELPAMTDQKVNDLMDQEKQRLQTLEKEME